MAENLDVGELRRMSRVELQTLAKTLNVNIRGNAKTVKLRDAIMEKMVAQSEQDAESPQVITETLGKEAPSSSVVVNEADGMNCCETPGKVRRMRRRTYDVITDFVPATNKGNSAAIKNESPPDAVTSSTESIYYAFTPTKGADADIEESTIYLSAKVDSSSTFTPQKLSPRVKTPKLKRIDKSVGQIPERKIYNLRSKATATANKPQKSLIPRPVQNKRAKDQKSTPKTPNFTVIHQKLFDKMDSIVDHISKKQQLRDNYKSLAIRGPTARIVRGTAVGRVGTTEADVFKPSILTTKRINLNFASMQPPSAPKTPKAVPPKNTSKAAAPAAANDEMPHIVVPSRRMFNLAESLARKLRYHPYTGPLPPLNECNTQPPHGNVKVSGENANTIRDKYRAENKTFLKGVRRNRRLDLQLKMRGVFD